MIERCGGDHKNDNDRDDDNVRTGSCDDHENGGNDYDYGCPGENENHNVEYDVSYND